MLPLGVREHKGEEQRKWELSPLGEGKLHAVGKSEHRQAGDGQLELVVVLCAVVGVGCIKGVRGEGQCVCV